MVVESMLLLCIYPALHSEIHHPTPKDSTVKSKGVRVARQSYQLPRELTRPNSDIDVFLTVAGDSADKRTFGFQQNIKTAQYLMKRNCGFYGPSEASDSNAILCSSGEADGSPRCGSACFVCHAGQFSASGFFTGEMTDSAPPDAVIQHLQQVDEGIELPY